MDIKKAINAVKFDRKGLVPAVVQDFTDGRVLMVAYMNRESLKITLRKKVTCFYSRSRKELWVKGMTSGNMQKVMDVFIDCDGDCLLVKVKQLGAAACHTGHRSCFYRKIGGNGGLKIVGKPLFDPKKVYK